MPSLAAMGSAWSATLMQLSTWRTPGSKVTACLFAPNENKLLSIHAELASLQ